MNPTNFRRHRHAPWVGALAVVVAAGTACLGLPAQAQAMPSAGTRSATVKTLTLVTGDRVIMAGGATASFTVVPLAGDTGTFQSFQDATGDHYVVPAVALPYLNRQLDRSLFDVSALVRDGLTGAANVPVDLTFTAGVAPTAPPGVTITSVDGGSAQGFVSGGAAFTAALREQIGADIAAGRPAGSGTLFGGLASLRLATAAAPATVTPHFPLAILQLNATDMTGVPTDAVTLLVNTDAMTREMTQVPIVAGIGRIAVPTGHYFAYTPFTDFDAGGNVTANRIVVVNDLTVAPAPKTSTVAIDERTASQQITVTTPRPAAKDGAIIHVLRFDATGADIPLTTLDPNGPTPGLFISPTPAAKVGKLHYVAQWDGASPTTAASPYRFDVAFGSDKGIPANENFLVRAGQLATVQVRFSTDPANTGSGNLLNGAQDATLQAVDDFAELGTRFGTPVPGTITQYLGTGDGGHWAQTVLTPFFDNEFNSDVVTFAGGHHYTVDWAHGPLAPGFGRYVGPLHLCLACTTGSTLSLGFNEQNDSVPNHVGFALAASHAHLVVSRDGASVFDGPVTAVDIDNVPATPSTYEAVLDLDLSGDFGITQSTASHTDVTFKFPAAGSSNTLPAGNACDEEAAGGSCQILPVLSLSYGLASDGTNTSGSATQMLRLSVGHLSYDGFGSHSRITSASVSVSFDGGTTWVPAKVSGTNGHYVATWANPASAAGTDPMLRVSAADASGDTISQTVTNAYTIAGSAS